MAEVDSLSIQINSSANAASFAIDELIKKLETLQGIIGSGKVATFCTDLKNAGNAMQDLDNNTKAASSSLTSLLKSFASFALVTKTLKSAITESMNFTETFNYFNVAMKEYTQEAEDYAEKVNRVLGINVEQWENSQATFMSLATTFGLTGKQANVMSRELTQLVYDLSSLKNVDPTVALQKLRSAFAGEIEPLRAWGVDLSKARLQLAATELGIKKTFATMTQAEKAQLRYYVIMKQTTDAQGDMARTLASPANQLRLLKQALTECARALGNVFIPLLQRVIPVAIAVVKVITMILEAIARLFGFKYPDVQWYGDYSAGVSGVGDAMDKTGRKAKKLKQQLAGFDEINNLTTNQPSGGSGNIGGGAFGDVPLPTYDFLGGAAEQANKLTTALKECLIPLGALVALMGILNYTLTGASPVGLIIAGIALIVAGLINLYNTSEGFRNWVNTTWEWLKGVFAGLQEGFNTIFGALAEWLWTAAENVGKFFSGAWDWVVNLWGKVTDFWAKLKEVWGNLKSTAVGVWENIKTAWQNAPAWFAEKWQNVKTKVAEKWASIKQGAVDAWTGIKNTFASIPTWFKEKFAAAWQKVKDVFSTGGQIFDGIKEGIVSAFKTVVNAIITGINKIIKIPFDKIKDILKTIKGINILGITPFSWINTSWSIPQIPQLAKGGIVNSPTLSLIGESGTEAVVPLENNTEWINKVAAQINANTDNDDVVRALNILIDVVGNKELVIDGKSLARGISKEINRQTRILGEGLVY